jgi:pyrroloquinoline quinone biosynthesis protein D
MNTVLPASLPRCMPGVRLQYDQTRAQWVIQAPERVIELDDIAYAIVRLCDGTRTIDTIVAELAVEFGADQAEVRGDVLGLIDDLVAKRVLRL